MGITKGRWVLGFNELVPIDVSAGMRRLSGSIGTSVQRKGGGPAQIEAKLAVA